MTQAQDRFRRVRAALNAGRSVLTTLGYNTTQVFIIRRTWEGGRRSADGGFVDEGIYQGKVINSTSGAGLVTTGDVGLEIVPRPKVRFLRTQELFVSGGIYHSGDLRITYIQPYWVDANSVQRGYTIEDIAPDTAPVNGVETFYRLSGSISGEYFRVGTITEKFGHYELTLRSRRTTPLKDGA